MLSGFHLVKRKQFVQFSPNTPHPSLCEVLPSLSRAHRPAFPPPFSVLSQQILNVCQLNREAKPLNLTPPVTAATRGSLWSHHVLYKMCLQTQQPPHSSRRRLPRPHFSLLVENSWSGSNPAFGVAFTESDCFVYLVGDVCVCKSGPLLVITLLKIDASWG